jgi:excisionase family DNA binding protein
MMLSVEEAARVLGIGRTVAYEGARSGWLPTVRLGGKKLGVPWTRLWRAFFS